MCDSVLTNIAKKDLLSFVKIKITALAYYAKSHSV